MVEIGGLAYKRAIAATGHVYYLYLSSKFSCITTRQSIWKLPTDYSIIDPSVGITSNSQSTTEILETIGSGSLTEGSGVASPFEEAVGAAEAAPDEETVELGLVEGYPDWRRVDCDDGVPYYFNVVTSETQWEAPGSE